MQEDTDIQTPSPLNDQVAKQLSDLGAGGAVPGQTFTPGDTSAPTAPADDQVSETGETPSAPSVAPEGDYEGFTPPADEEDNQETSTAEGDVSSGPVALKPNEKVIKPLSDSEPIDEPETTVKPVVGDLDEVKKAALEELTPLVDKLELAPEKQYDLLMEIIESGGKSELLKQAFESAHGIADEEMRAQALVKIVQKIKEFEK